MFPNKQTSRDAVVAHYGHIDFHSQQWPEKNKWMGMLQIPPSWFPKWIVGETTHPVNAIYANKDIHGPLLAALQHVHDQGLGDLLHTYDGCFNIRMVRGSNSSFSAHSYGLALDLNCNENPLGATHGGFYKHPEFVKCFTDQGFAWGGNFHSRKDPMHFSYCWEG